MIADDLFAGAGGWDVGAADLGVVGRGVEIMPAARATSSAAGLSTIHHDVWTYQPDGLAEGLIASPPCQTFSRAGKGTGRKALDDVYRAIDSDAYTDLGALQQLGTLVGDERTALVLTPLHFATMYDYRWLAFEQVPAVLPVWEACADVLRELGWRVWTGNLNAERYGVPQTRRRAVLLASQSRDVDMPAPTHSRYYRYTPDRLDDGVPPWVSMAEALGGLTEAGAWLPEWCHRRPATTVVGTFRPDVIASPGYRTTVSRQNAPDSVHVSVAEAGVLQSFPADYPWTGAKGKQYLQVGNAVPPLLARAALAEATGLPLAVDEPLREAL